MSLVDVIIPVYRPTEKLLTLLYRLEHQTAPAGRVIVINTEQSYWEQFFASYDVLKRYPFLEVHHITKEEFDHAGTRNYGVHFSDSEFFLLMTDDCVPKDEHLIWNLRQAFRDPEIGMAYARQIADQKAGAIEKYTRLFNYPPKSVKKGKDDLETLGIKAFFASNVCCMYRRDIFDDLKGFTEPALFNEDMVYARRMIDRGYKIAYCADAKVIHSHNYTGKEQFRRNFANGISHAEHPETFGDVKAEGEGIALVKRTTAYLCKKGLFFLTPKLLWQSACKYAGYTLGERCDKLPIDWVKRLSGNPEYFDKKEESLVCAES